MKQNNTKATSKKEIIRAWHVIDVKGKIIGRISSSIAELLMGKKKSYFVRNIDCGDYVVIINAKDIKITGKKSKEKKYYRHSGYPGGLRAETFQELQHRRPEKIVHHAVLGMLPQNKLRDSMMKRLFIFAGAEHTYKDKLKG
jgi:large subunit ribosomal protein L13